MLSHRRYIVLSMIMLFCSSNIIGQTTGIVLSGGGARGMAHIGVLKALEENNIPIDYIAGTSAGALVGAMYAAGKSPKEMEDIVLSSQFREWASGFINEDYDYYFNKKTPDASWVTLKFSIDSVIRTYIPTSVVSSAVTDFSLMERLSAAIAKANYDFDSLFVPFRCVAADIKSHQQVIFESGDLPLAVRSSMAYPLYFSPISLNDMILFDGGIYNNFPVDVMQTSFNPDVIIGVNTGSYTDLTYEDNIFSLFKTMVIQTTSYTLPRPGDILVNPDVMSIEVFGFDQLKAAIDSGYYATIRKLPEIRKQINRQINHEDIIQRRQQFTSQLHNIEIDQVKASGINQRQERYVKKVLNPDNECLQINDLKADYFKLVTDRNIQSIFPRLKYNQSTGYYDMDLLVKKEKDLKLDFGGNISSSPINQGFVGAQYGIWGKNSLIIQGNIYFGKLYNSGTISLKHVIPSKIPFFFEPFATINQFDYFKSSGAFLQDIKPAYLITNDRIYGVRFGVPARNKGIISASGGAFSLKERYYQDRNFSFEDIPDETDFVGGTIAIQFERSTLNRRMYANQGTYFSITTRYVNGSEETSPGSTSVITDTTKNYHDWMQLRMLYDNYFKRVGPFRMGLYTEMYLSSQPFFSNYTASILSTKGFEPIPQSQTLFLENYHSHNYIGMGLKVTTTIVGNLEARAEGYVYQPFQEIIPNAELKAKYGEAFANRYYMATLAALYNSPFGPLSLSINYYSKREEPLSVMLHFGYIIFNRKALF